MDEKTILDCVQVWNNNPTYPPIYGTYLQAVLFDTAPTLYTYLYVYWLSHRMKRGYLSQASEIMAPSLISVI